MSNWIKMPIALESQPDFSDLFGLEESYFRLWYRLVIISVHADDDGWLTYRGGKPWELRHIADSLKVSPEKAAEFLTHCVELELVEVSPEATDIGSALSSRGTVLKVADFDTWYGKNSSTERVRQFRLRQKSENVTLHETDETLHETQCNNHETNDGNGVTALEKRREEKRREEKIRSDKTRARGLRCPQPLIDCSFGIDEFLNAADLAHAFLVNKPLPKTSVKNTMSKSEGAEWRVRAGALLLAAQQVQHEMDGKPIANPWGYVLPLIPSHFKLASQYIALAESEGVEPEFHWAPTVKP